MDIPEGTIRLVLVDELRSQDRPVAGRLPVQEPFLKQDPERVTFAQVSVKIHVPGKEFGQGHRQLGLLAQDRNGAEQVVGDHPGGAAVGECVRMGLPNRHPARFGAVHLQETISVDAVAEAFQPSVAGQLKIEEMAGADHGQVVHRPDGAEQEIHFAGQDAIAAQVVADHRAGLDRFPHRPRTGFRLRRRRRRDNPDPLISGAGSLNQHAQRPRQPEGERQQQRDPFQRHGVSLS